MFCSYMRILIVTDVFPPGCDGSGWSTYYLCKALRSEGHDIIIITAKKGDVSIYDGFKVYNEGHRISELSFLKMRKRARILANKFDIVHAQHAKSCRAIAPLKNIKKVCTIRDHWPLFYDGTKFDERKVRNLNRDNNILDTIRSIYSKDNVSLFVRIFSPPAGLYMVMRTYFSMSSLKKIDNIICVSDYVRQTLLPHFDSKKLTVIHNMIDFDSMSEIKTVDLSDKKNIVYLGKLNVPKGALFFAKSLARLPSSVKEKLNIIFIGDGASKNKISKILDESTICCEFKGYLENQVALSIIKSSYAFVSTSLLNDTLSRSILEACAMGTAVIASNVGGTPEIIQHEKNGLLYDVNSDELNNCIIKVVDDVKFRDKLAKNALISVKKKFDYKVLIHEYEEYYNSLL